MESANCTPMDAPEGPTYTWLCVTTSAGKFIVKTAVKRDSIKGIHEAGGVLHALEVFDYGCPVQPMPTPSGGMSLAKMHFSSRMDSTMFPCEAYISLSGALLYYMDDLDERNGDAEHYREFLQNAASGATDAARHRTAQRSGIVTATGLPTGGYFGRR